MDKASISSMRIGRYCVCMYIEPLKRTNFGKRLKDIPIINRSHYQGRVLTIKCSNLIINTSGSYPCLRPNISSFQSRALKTLIFLSTKRVFGSETELDNKFTLKIRSSFSLIFPWHLNPWSQKTESALVCKSRPPGAADAVCVLRKVNEFGDPHLRSALQFFRYGHSRSCS